MRKIFCFSKSYLLFVCMFLSGCATMQNREMHAELIKNVRDKNYPAAIEIVKSDKFYAEKRSALLRKMETGTTYFDAGMYYTALKEFDAAKSLSDKLYTKSISAKLKSLLDSNQSEFYGDRFERSQIRFYQSLTHYKLWTNGKYEPYGEQPEKILSDKEKNFHLNAAKSVVREWESIFSQFASDTAGKPVYKTDLMQHLWGAFLNEQIGASEDRQIALGLYRRAKEVMLKNYNIYPVFNKKFDKFIDEFSKLSSMDIKKVEEKYVSKTDNAKEVLSYIDKKIDTLSKGSVKNNLVIVVKEGLISEKKSKEYSLEFDAERIAKHSHLSMHISSASGGSGQKLAAAAFIPFALAYLLKDITYDMPYIDTKPINDIKAVIKSDTGKEIEIPLVISSPLSEIAYHDINSRIPGEKTVLITRLTVEYIGAAVTAYKTYEKVKAENKTVLGEILAIGAATATFKGLGAAINASNKADLRQWKLLPNSIRFIATNVPKGNYTLTISTATKTQTQKITIGKDLTFVDFVL